MAKRLLASSTCGHCIQAKAMLKPLIDRKEVTVTEVTESSPEADKFLVRHFKGVPTLVEEKDGKACELDIQTLKTKKCVAIPQQQPTH